jgi:YHS domain-containing protein
MLLKKLKSLSAAAIVFAAFSFSAQAAERINTLEKKGFFSYDESGIAIRGTDTVAYFTEGKPVPGSEEFEADWQGATWRFSSQQNLDLFTNDPEKYAPQYGGYCAYGVAQGYLVKIEPELWTIRDGKLYLNYDDDVQEKWEQDIQGFISAADSAFEGLLAE